MRPKTRDIASGIALSVAAAACGFVLWSWPLATKLSTHTVSLVTPASEAGADWDTILASDQALSLWNTAENARAITARRWGDLLSAGQCYPMPTASTLGEHMIETGVLAAPWWKATNDPVLSYNLAIATSLVIAATGMFLFVFFHTGSVPAALVGAIAFSFSPPRLADIAYHPAVVGLHWLPWVLWSFERLVLRITITRTILFAATLLLASLVGSYPLMSVAIFAGSYGVARLVELVREEHWSRRSFMVVASGLLPAATAVVLILKTYGRVHESWALPPNPGAKFLASLSDYLPFATLSAGGVALIGLVPLVLMRREAGRRAVVPLAVATALALVIATAIPLPGQVSGVYELLVRMFPLLDAVRAPGKIGLAAGFGLAALGAIGWSRLLLSMQMPMAAGVAAALVAAIAFESSIPISRGVAGRGAVSLREIAPPPERIAMLRAVLGDPRDRRAVLDLPFGRMVRAPAALIDAAYHGHPTTACYNSLGTPATRAIEELGSRSHLDSGILELEAAGIGYIVERTSAMATPFDFPSPARLISLETGITIWGMPHPGVQHRDVAKLEMKLAGGATRKQTYPPDPPFEIDVDVTNRAPIMFAPDTPLRPVFADVDLVRADGSGHFRSRARGVLPLALSPGATARMHLVVPEAPQPGEYRATVAIEGSSQRLASESFRWADESR